MKGPNFIMFMSNNKIQNVKEICSLVCLLLSLILSFMSRSSGNKASKNFFVTQLILITPFIINYGCLYLTSHTKTNFLNYFTTSLIMILIILTCVGSFSSSIIFYIGPKMAISQGTVTLGVLGTYSIKHFLWLYFIIVMTFYALVVHMENCSYGK